MTLRDRVARIIVGPYLPVPADSAISLNQLREIRWGMADSQEKGAALLAADALIREFNLEP